MPPRTTISVPGSQLDRLREDALRAESLGRHAQAIDLAKRYLARRPNDIGVMNFLAKTYLEDKRWEEFLPIGLRSFRKEPKAKHLLLLLKGYRALGRFDTALVFYEQESKRPDGLLDGNAGVAREIAEMVRAIEKDRQQASKRARAAERSAAKAPAVPAAPVAPTPAVQTTPKDDRATWQANRPEWPRREPAPVQFHADVDSGALAVELVPAGDANRPADQPAYELEGLYLKDSGLEERFCSEFQWLHVRAEFTGHRHEHAEYLGVETYFTVEGDPARDGFVEALIQRGTGAVVTLPPGSLDNACGTSGRPWEGAGAMEASELLTLASAAAEASSVAVERELADLIDQQQHALEREIEEEETLLHAEWEARRRQLAPDAADVAHTARTIIDDLLRRRRSVISALQDTHAVAVRLQPLALRRLTLPVVVCTVHLERRKATAWLKLTWNPLTKHFEPVPCGHCGRLSYALGATDACQVRCARCAPH